MKFFHTFYLVLCNSKRKRLFCWIVYSTHTEIMKYISCPSYGFWIGVVDKHFMQITWTTFLMRVVQAQPGAVTIHRTKEIWARTGKVWQSSGDAEVQMRLHFQFNFTVQFKSPYSLLSNFIFSISNITISFQKLILRDTRKYNFCIFQGSEKNYNQVAIKSDLNEY